MLKRLGALRRFVLGMVGLLVLMALTAALWWWLPAWPHATLASSGRGACELIHIAPNGQTLVVVHLQYRGFTVAFWDVPGCRELGVTPYPAYTFRLLLSPDGQTLADVMPTSYKAELSGTLRLWRPATQPVPVSLPGTHDFVDFTADSRFLATWTGGTYKFWDVATLRERPFPILFHDVHDVRLLGDGRIVVIDRHHQEGWLVDLMSTTVWTFTADFTLASEPVHLPGLRYATVSPDGRLCTAWQIHGEPPYLIKLYELNTGRELGSFRSMGHGGKVVFSPDGTRLITDAENLWDITTKPPRLVGSEDGLCLEFSPDGKWLRGWPCRRGPAETTALLDAATFQKQRLRTDTRKLTFAPDSQTIAGKEMVTPSSVRKWLATWVPGLGRTDPYEALQVWTLPDWREVASFPNARTFAYFPDGQRIAVSREDGTVELWDLPPRRPWWIDYGLPVVFALLLLLAVRLVRHAFRRKAPTEARSC